MKRSLVLLLVLLILTGCFDRADEPEQNEEMDVAISQDAIQYYSQNERFSLIIPFIGSRQRLTHEQRSVYKEDTYEVTKQLQSMSAQYFNPSDYYIAEGRMISSDQYTNLLRFNSQEYPMGLNPTSDQVFVTENGQEITQPIILVTMYEIDYYTSPNRDEGVAAMSFALALNGNLNQDALDPDKLSDSDLIEYGENAARKLVSYLRTIPETSQIPIFVGLYNLNKSDSTLPGGFISSAYFEGNSGQFERINQEWVIFPSSRANQLAPDVSTEFNILRNHIQTFLPEEQVGVVGRARLIDNQINQLNITLSTTGKTYLEVQGLAQYAFQLMQQRLDHFDFDILIDIQVLGDTVMVIEKKGEQIKMVEW